MRLTKKIFDVKPNMTGYLYNANVLQHVLTPGRYELWDFKDKLTLLNLPNTAKMHTVTNHEVLTKDNIALRFSFVIMYKISDGEKFLQQFSLDRDTAYIIWEAEQRVNNAVQLAARRIISALDSESLNEQRANLTNISDEACEQECATLGITLLSAQFRDITFPKNIQDLFAKHLEAKIRAKADIENARTAVATARALKNASDLMSNDDNIRFLQMLEMISKIAEKGKHTFVLGENFVPSKK